MSRRPLTHLSADESRRSTSAASVRAHLFDVDVDRPKRIDHYIDYFGHGGARRPVVTSTSYGEGLLDADNAR
jgi:hypothetical protein